MTESDIVYEALANETRRQLLTILGDHGPGPVDVSTLVSRLAAEDEPSMRALLYHAHLPYLDDLEVVRWVPDAEAVAPGSRFEELAPFLGGATVGLVVR